MFDDIGRSIESVAQAIENWLVGLTPGEQRRYLLLLAVAGLGYLVMRLVVRRLIPMLLRGGITVVHGLLVVLAVLGLFVQGLCAMPFRVARRRPPRLLYRSGDAMAASMPPMRRATIELKAGTYALARTPPLIVLAFSALLIWQSHQFACDHDRRSEFCRQPVDAVAQFAGNALDAG